MREKLQQICNMHKEAAAVEHVPLQKLWIKSSSGTVISLHSLDRLQHFFKPLHSFPLPLIYKNCLKHSTIQSTWVDYTEEADIA